ncbi:hypothetical protein J6590_009230 [Homalodisca vitripennis]|nr:hypothetical protein J6590_009230 [Homalodisca vitripennis]
MVAILKTVLWTVTTTLRGMRLLTRMLHSHNLCRNERWPGKNTGTRLHPPLITQASKMSFKGEAQEETHH